MNAADFIGRRVGNYVIESLLGEGGMGAVFCARHTVLDERLAIKVLRPELAARPDIVARFEAEARAASASKHPNIIRVSDIGRFDTGEHFLCLEYLDGYPVDRLATPASLETILCIAVQVCSALEAAHARRIIHRDLKPANLFINPQPHNPLHTKVLDFGIAKLVGDTAAGGIDTQTHVVMGTPAYMAQEQARGSANVTPQSDLYSMGVILYELATGHRPYRATSIGELVSEQIVRPAPDPAALRPDLPAGWCAVVAACLAYRAEHRPASAADLAELLIAATPGGADIARSLGFVPTGRARLPASDGGTASLGSSAQPTTLSAGSGETREPAGPRRRRWPIAAAVVATVAIAGAGLAVLRVAGSDDDAAGDPRPAATAIEDMQPAEASADSPAGLRLDAAPASARLRIEVEPAGASVFVDRQRVGASPLDLERPHGAEVELWIEAAGYRAAERTVIAGVNDVEHFQLEPEKTAGQVATPARPGRQQSPTGSTKRPRTKEAWDVPQGDDPFLLEK